MIACKCTEYIVGTYQGNIQLDTRTDARTPLFEIKARTRIGSGGQGTLRRCLTIPKERAEVVESASLRTTVVVASQ